MGTDGSSSVVDGNGTTVTDTDADHMGGSAAADVDGSSAIFGTAIKKTGSDVNTLTTTADSSSGSVTSINWRCIWIINKFQRGQQLALVY